MTEDGLRIEFEKNRGREYVQKGERVIHNITINSANYFSTGATFNNVVFNGDVTIEGTDIGHFFRFIDCEFRRNVKINNAVLNMDLADASQGSVSFTRGRIHGALEISGSEIRHGVQLSHLSAISILNVETSNFTEGKFYIDAIQEFHSIKLTNSIFAAGFKINGCKSFKDSFETSNIEGHYFSLTDCHFSDKIRLWKGNFTGGLIFNDFRLDGNLEIEAFATQKLSFMRFHCKRSVKIEFCDYGSEPGLIRGFAELNIDHFNSEEGFYINQFKTDEYPNLPVQKVNINLTMVQAPDIVMGRFDVLEFRLEGINNNNKISLKRISAFRLNLENFTNNKQLFFANFGVSNMFQSHQESFVRINDSILGNTQFLDFDLSGYDKIQIGSSIISEITTANVKWFNEENLDIIQSSENESEDLMLEKKIEVFRQLKLAMNKHDNRRQALAFQSHEYKYYKKLVDRENYKSKNKFGDRMSLLAGWTNDFGQNWIKPLLLMIVVVGLFNFVIIFSARYLGRNGITTCIFCDTVCGSLKEAVLLLNPVHNLGEVFKSAEFRLNGLLYFIDFFQRLFVGFFIVQIVSAFRKYFKN